MIHRPRRVSRTKRAALASRRGNPPVAGRLLRFEPLEDRRLLSITVNTLVDEDNGVAVGGISLRDAIAAATPGETINFAPSLTVGGFATIELMHGTLAIDKDLQISGPGSLYLSIDGDAIGSTPTGSTGAPIFTIGDGNFVADHHVTISGLAIRNGRSMYAGGGIFNSENLTIVG